MSEVFLDTLNAKQLVKEYKTVAKSVKNKDDAIKLQALAKLLEDCRYMTDGACVLPLLEIIAPKKKTLEFSQVALEHLLRFLVPPPTGAEEQVSSEEGGEGDAAASAPAGRVSENPALDILNTIRTLSTVPSAAAAAEVGR